MVEMGHQYTSGPLRFDRSIYATSRYCPVGADDVLHSFSAAFRSSWYLTGRFSLGGATLLLSAARHSHSIILSHGNALI